MFLCSTELMGLAARFLGRILGPRGKIHKPIPPPAAADLAKFLENYRSTVRMRVKSSPTIGLKIGTLDNSDEEISENAISVYNTLLGKLPKGAPQIKKVIMKTTMGSPVKILIRN